MGSGSRVRASTGTLPVILIAAVLQGWGLYGLHHAIAAGHWPATSNGWVFACYGAVLFAPLTLELLAAYTRQRHFWVVPAVIGLAYAGFGAHHGTAVFMRMEDGWYGAGGIFALGIEAVVLWLLVLPFVQARYATGRWNLHYPALFAASWNNALLLAEAVLFTGLFWLLLGLCAALFRLLGIGFFRELFTMPIFVYPVTALTFGVALHLIGSIDRLTSVLLEQVLNLLKWLAVIAGLILTLFALTLVFKLPELLASGQRAIGAAWLLWLVAVMVLLLNAAYRDGSVARPYPPAVARLLRWIVPLLVIVALMALYALGVRTRRYGLTVTRIWAWIVAAAAFAYAVGYSASSFNRAGWLPGIARVNVGVALALIGVLVCALTPLASPYRLAANSQFRAALRPVVAAAPADDNPQSMRTTPFDYLRFDAGRYGVDRLQQLTQLDAGEQSERIHEAARAALARRSPWKPSQPDAGEYLATLTVYPAGHALDAALVEALGALVDYFGKSGIGIFTDLDGDGVDEFVLLNPSGNWSFRYHEDTWKKLGQSDSFVSAEDWRQLRDAVNRGEVRVVSPLWKQLQIGTRRFDVVPTR